MFKTVQKHKHLESIGTHRLTCNFSSSCSSLP